MIDCTKSAGTKPTDAFTAGANACRGTGQPAAELLSLPAATGDDLITALAMLTVKQKHDDRVAANHERLAGEQAQQEAQSRKIDKMRELAKDTWMQGLVEGVLEGASAVAMGASAVEEFSAATQPKGATDAMKLESAKLARNAKLLEAGSRGLTAASHFGGAMARSAQENDRKDMAIADRDVDHAKAAVDGASSAGRQADDDIRETLNAIRQYLAAKTALANAAIIKG